MRVLASAIVLLGVVASPLFAQTEPISADRPGFADGPGIVDLRHVQVELGIGIDHDDDSLLTVPTLVRYGLTESLELRLESDVLGISDGDGEFAPFSAGVKWNFRGGETPLSLIASIQPPSGGGALRTTDFEGEARVVSDVDLGGGLSLTPNVGVSIGEGGPLNGIVAASLEKEVGKAIPFIDFEVQSQDGDTSAIADAGIAWIVHPDIQLDVSGGKRLTGDGYSEWFVSAGVSRRFPGSRRTRD